MKNVKLSVKISIITIVILVAGLFMLWFSTNTQMTEVMENSIVQQLNNSVQTQAQVVRNYVDKAESYLIGYAQAPEMASVLKNTGNAAGVTTLQEYTDAYAKTGDNLENIYAADWGSTVIASHVQGEMHLLNFRMRSLRECIIPVLWHLRQRGCRLSLCTIR